MTLLKADQAMRHKSWEKARALYQRILQKDPGNARANAGWELASARLDADKTLILLRKENALRARERENKKEAP